MAIFRKLSNISIQLDFGSWKAFLFPILLYATFFCITLEANEKKPSHIIFCPKYVQNRDTPTIFVEGAYLYWNIYQTGINIALQQNTPTQKKSIARPKLSPASGYKIKLSGSADHDGWLASLQYTWLYYSPATLQNKLAAPYQYSPNFASHEPTYNEINSKFEVIFNRVDAKLFRPTYLGYYVYYSPWLGLSGTWDKQNLRYVGNKINLAFDDANLVQNFVGIGPYVGLEGTYFLYGPAALYLSFGSALYFANHSVENALFSYENASFEGEAINNSLTSIYAVEVALDTSLGLKIEQLYPTWSICFNVGWELQTYFSHNGFLPFYSPTGNKGDFSLQGLTTSLQIGF